MKYAIVFFAGMAAPYVAWWAFTMLHDYVYMPLVWEPRHRRWCEKTSGSKSAVTLRAEQHDTEDEQ